MESCGMIKRLLTESELAEIAEARDDPEFKERLGRRLMAVRRHGLGVANSKIAGILRGVFAVLCGNGGKSRLKEA